MDKIKEIKKDNVVNNTVEEIVNNLSIQRNNYIKELKELNNDILILEKIIKIYNISIDMIKNSFGD